MGNARQKAWLKPLPTRLLARLKPRPTRPGPAHGVEATNTPQPHLVSLGAEQLALDLQVAAVATQAPTSRDDAVARCRRVAAFAEDAADRPMRARRTGERRDVAIRGDAAGRDSPHRRENTPGER